MVSCSIRNSSSPMWHPFYGKMYMALKNISTRVLKSLGQLIGKSTKHLPGIIYFMKAIQWNSHIMESLDWIINMLSLIDFLYLFNTFYRICSITKVCRCISVNEQRNLMISFPLLYIPHILSQVNFIKLGFLIKILSNLNIA